MVERTKDTCLGITKSDIRKVKQLALKSHSSIAFGKPAMSILAKYRRFPVKVDSLLKKAKKAGQATTATRLQLIYLNYIGEIYFASHDAVRLTETQA